MSRKRQGSTAAARARTMLAAIFETAVDGIITIDEAGAIQAMNPAAERIFGYRASEVVGRDVGLLMPPPYREEHLRYLESYLATGRGRIIGLGREVVGLRKDGSLFPMDLAVSEFRAGSRRMFAGIVRDITERKAAEEALRTRARQQEVVAHLGRLGLSGKELGALMGEAVGRVAEVLGVEFCQVLELLADSRSLVLRAGAGWKRELVGRVVAAGADDSQAGFTLRAGEPVVVEDLEAEGRFRASRLLRDHGVVSGVSVVIEGGGGPYGILGVHSARRRAFSQEDVYFVQSVATVLGITIQHRRDQERLLRQESMTRLGELAAVVAHEVRNPLAGINGALSVLYNRLPAGSENRAIIEEILTRLRDLNHSVNDILIFARPRVPVLQPVPVFLLLDDILSLLRKDPQFALVSVDVTGEDCTVSCDPEMLKPVFHNILVNAAQAMGGQGRVSIRVSREDECARGGCFQVLITDGGPGIPEELRDRVFEPFFSSKNSGTGLGLPIARRLVELHGGQVRLGPPPAAGGTQVVVELPVAPEAAAGGSASGTGPPGGGKKPGGGTGGRR